MHELLNANLRDAVQSADQNSYADEPRRALARAHSLLDQSCSQKEGA